MNEKVWVRCPNQSCKVSLQTILERDTQCPDCKTIFRYISCPYMDCDELFVFGEGSFVQGKRYQCGKCNRHWQKMACPNCTSKITFTKKEYVEGNTLRCPDCDKPFQMIFCSFCNRSIMYRDASYEPGSVVQCPYSDCHKTFQQLICPFCVRSIVFRDCGFVEGRIEICPYANCGKKFQLIHCGHCRESIYFKNGNYIEGTIQNCPTCKKDFQHVSCVHCNQSIVFKNCNYKFGRVMNCPYQNCGKSFQELPCPKCTRKICWKGCGYREGVRVQCSYDDCKCIFQQRCCPNCSESLVWENGDYNEGEIVKCPSCEATWQAILCPYCRRDIVWKEGNKKETQVQCCPYDDCGKKFYHINCSFCEKPVVLTDWKRYLPGSNVLCPYKGCEKLFKPGASPTYILNKNKVRLHVSSSSSSSLSEKKEKKEEIIIEMKKEEEKEKEVSSSSQQQQQHFNLPSSIVSSSKGEGKSSYFSSLFRDFINERDKKKGNELLIPYKSIKNERDEFEEEDLTMGPDGTFGSSKKAKIGTTEVSSKELLCSLPVEEIVKEVEEVMNVIHISLLPPIHLAKNDVNQQSYCLIYERMNGGSLRTLYEENKQELSNFEKWFLIRKMILSVKALHDSKEGLFHRDLKCSNWLFPTKARRTLKLMDYGLPKTKESARKTTLGRFNLRIAFKAPEILLKNNSSPIKLKKREEEEEEDEENKDEDDYSEFSDVFSLGMSIFELIRGSFPFGKVMNQNQIHFLVGKGQRPDLPAELPKAFKDLVKMCWYQSSSNRASLEELLEFLESEESEFVEEHPPPKKCICDLFCCSISGMKMEDPVILDETGYAFEGAVLEEWLKRFDVDPLSGKKLNSKKFHRSESLKKSILLAQQKQRD